MAVVIRPAFPPFTWGVGLVPTFEGTPSTYYVILPRRHDKSTIDLARKGFLAEQKLMAWWMKNHCSSISQDSIWGMDDLMTGQFWFIGPLSVNDATKTLIRWS